MNKTLLFLCTAITASVLGQSPLYIPDTLSGSVIQLELQKGSRQFFSGSATQTLGANGAMLGPTVILRKHQNVTMRVKNSIGDSTTLHWHGMHVAPENDGGPHVVIAPGTTWSPAFEVLDNASTHWYHPHLHMRTNEHVQKGIAGLIIVKDQAEAALNLPRRYGLDDFPVIIQTKSFDAGNQIVTQQTALDTTLMVNGTLKPFLNAPAQVIRLRLLNGSSERVYNLGFSDNRTFHQIGSDGGLLAAPAGMTRLLLAPGERAEILLNLQADSGKLLSLKNYGTQFPNAHYGAAQPGMGAGQTIPNYNLNPLNGKDFDILQLRVVAPSANPVSGIPATLASHSPWAEASANITRTLTFTSMTMGPGAINGPFLINNAHFDMDIINYKVPFNNIEIWELRNQTPIAHPFHIHNVQFYVLSINGAQPPANLRGKKDVVLVPGGNGVVRFITKFEDFYNDTLPYMYHCHMLTHEDDGMMGQFVVNSPCSLITAQPESVAAAPADSAVFSVSVSDTTGVVYQWQSNIGFGFQDLQNAGQYSGAQSAILTVSNVALNNNNQLFRCLVSGPVCNMLSDVVSIQVNASAIIKHRNRLLQLMPNPAGSGFTITSLTPQDNAQLTILDVCGKTVYKRFYDSFESEYVDVQVPDGVYTVELISNHQMQRLLLHVRH